jgi:predicted naringenin-chalcone synthase
MCLSGIGTAVPHQAIAQSLAAQYAATFVGDGGEHERQVELLYRRTGVHSRHSVVLEKASGEFGAITQSFYPPAESSDELGPTTAARMRLYETWGIELARAAAIKALEDAQTDPAEVTHLITVSCTGFASPGVDLQLIVELPLRHDVPRTHVGFMGCHGLMNALRVAQAFIQADSEACVLVCAVELCSLHQQYGWEPERVVANALFADGAAAIVGKCESRFSDGWTLVANGSTVLPATADKMSWKIHDHGFVMGLSPQVPALIAENLGPWTEAWLLGYGLEVSQIPHWAIHPGGPKILQAAQAALGLSDSQLAHSRSVLQQYGNMSSPTVGFILDRLRGERDGKPCMMLGFGPGVSIEAALLA